MKLERINEIIVARGAAPREMANPVGLSILRYLDLECESGHKFTIQVRKLLTGSWCHKCSCGISERICRTIFERLFCTEFPRSRPEWLTSSGGHRLELDGFAKELSLAFEYNGEQHYRDCRGHFANKPLKYRRKLDLVKKRRCTRQGVNLIVVPYTVQYQEMERYIRTRCSKLGFKPIAAGPIDLDNIKMCGFQQYEKNKLDNICRTRSITCLSPTYVGNGHKLLFKCDLCDNEWSTTPSIIKSGSGCPHRCTKRKGGLNEHSVGPEIHG